jgi:hypothetical protein
MTDYRPNHERLARVLARRHRSAVSGAMVVSVLLHLFVFLLWPDALVLLNLREDDADRIRARAEPPRLVQLASPPPQAVIVETPPTAAPINVAIQRAVVFRPVVDTKRAPDEDFPPVRLASSAAPRAEPEQYNQPIARNILPDWKFPETLHGVVVTARTYVTPAGRSTGIVELVPATKIQNLDDEIVYLMRRLEYQPAYRNGKPVAAWAEITFTFCGRSVRATSPAAPRNRVAPCAKSDVVLAADSQ